MQRRVSSQVTSLVGRADLLAIWVLLAACPRSAAAQSDDNGGTWSPEALAGSPTYSPDVPAKALGQSPAEPEGTEPATAPAPKVFGDAGVTVLSGGLGVSNLSLSSTEASQFSVWFEPGIDYFVGRALSFGGYVLGSYTDRRGYDYFGPLIVTKETGYGGGFRVGVDFPAGKPVNVWPKLSLGYTHYDATVSARSVPASLMGILPNRIERSTEAIWIELFVPVLFHPAPHYFLGLGPSVFTDLARDATFVGGGSLENKRTRVALVWTMGGWL